MFECPECHKQFRLRMPAPCVPAQAGEEDTQEAPASLIVLENAFHFRQEIPLCEGENKVGRYVKGTRINAPVKTVDPSVDETHCIFTLRRTPDGNVGLTLRDAPSNTGTFVQNELLGVGERVTVADGTIVTIGATTMIVRVGKGESE